MNYSKLKELWEKEEQATFKGGDFSHLENRCDEEELPWSYEDILKKYLESDCKLLDMGTGGGEFIGLKGYIESIEHRYIIVGRKKKVY